MGSDAGAVRDVDPSPAKAGLWEDFVDIFYTPSTVFARRSDGKFGPALLFLVIAGVILFFLTKNAMAPIMDAEFARQSADMMRQNPNLTAEQLSKGRGFFETFVPLIFAVTFPLTIILTGVVLWAIGKLFDAKESVAMAIMVATYSQVPRLVQFLTNAAQGLLMDPDRMTSVNSVSFSIARFMNSDTAQPVLLALAGRVELFTIWATVLLAIGLHVVGRIPKQSAGIAAALTWLVGGLPTVLDALRKG